MDLIKIGNYISEKRKNLGMTQKQLAEKLGMSDKSVSKWERGVCLPDVSVYSDLCQILGIGINEFLAGEDIAQENIGKKSEENIIGVVTDSKNRQMRLKIIISVLLFITILTFSIIGVTAYISNRPQNYITPVAKESVEMKTASLFNEMGGVFFCKFRTTDKWKVINLYISEYQEGELVNKSILAQDNVDWTIERISPQEGEILIIPNFSNRIVKCIVSADEIGGSSEQDILGNARLRGHYSTFMTGINKTTNIRYDEEQVFAALIYDEEDIEIVDFNDLVNGGKEYLEKNDRVYLISYEFCK